MIGVFYGRFRVVLGATIAALVCGFTLPETRLDRLAFEQVVINQKHFGFGNGRNPEVIFGQIVFEFVEEDIDNHLTLVDGPILNNFFPHPSNIVDEVIVGMDFDFSFAL